jgi:hypothetical protein
MMREVVDTAAKEFGASHPTTLLYRMELASGLSKYKHFEESEQQFQTAWQDAQSAKIPGATRTAIAVRFARLYQLWGKPVQAEHYNQLAVAATQPTTAPTTGLARD